MTQNEDSNYIYGHTNEIEGIRALLVANGLRHSPPKAEDVDLNDEESMADELDSALFTGLANLLEHISSETQYPLRMALGYFFINNGHEPEDFSPKMEKALELIQPYFKFKDDGDEDED